jgi:hypothetical protein
MIPYDSNSGGSTEVKKVVDLFLLRVRGSVVEKDIRFVDMTFDLADRNSLGTGSSCNYLNSSTCSGLV